MELVGTRTPAPTTIGVRFVAAAVRLVTEYFWRHARAAIRQIGLTEGHAKARKVLRWLRAERRDQVSIEDVRRDALQQSLNAEATANLIEALVQAGWLREPQLKKEAQAGTHIGGQSTPSYGPQPTTAGSRRTRRPPSKPGPRKLRKLRKIRRSTPRSQFPQFPQFPQLALTAPPTMDRRHGRRDFPSIRARDVGLRLEVAGNALKITGPKEAEPFVRLLAKHKAQVLEALTNSGLREIAGIAENSPREFLQGNLPQSVEEEARRDRKHGDAPYASALAQVRANCPAYVPEDRWHKHSLTRRRSPRNGAQKPRRSAGQSESYSACTRCRSDQHLRTGGCRATMRRG